MLFYAHKYLGCAGRTEYTLLIYIDCRNNLFLFYDICGIIKQSIAISIDAQESTEEDFMSIDEIKRKYNIETDSLEEIKAELLKRIKQNHPDESNYKTIDDNIEITDLIIEYDYIQSLIGTDRKQEVSIPINEVVKAFTEIMQMPTRKEKDPAEVLSEKLNTSINTQVMATKKKLSFPRYSSIGITAIITFLWLFPKQVLEHPFVKMFVSDYKQGFFYGKSLKHMVLCANGYLFHLCDD